LLKRKEKVDTLLYNEDFAEVLKASKCF